MITRLRVLTKAVCENIFSTIETRILRFNFMQDLKYVYINNKNSINWRKIESTLKKLN